MAAAAEISETTTPEEIQSFVDTIAKERAGENGKLAEKGFDADLTANAKGDAQITSEHADNEQRKPATDRGETAEAPESEGDEPDSSQDWLDDDLKAEVAAYGISEDELAEFSSREELERAFRLFDKAALDKGRKALAETDESKARDDKGRFTKTETEPEGAEDRKGGFEVKLSKDVYDDEIVDEFTRLRDHYESRLATLEQRFLEADAQAEERHFDSLIDSLGHADLFGKTGKENEKQLARREELFVASKAFINGLGSYGRPTEMSESLINRVARMVFAEEIGKKDLKARTAKISRQSNGRQGGGVTRPSEPSESPRDWADKLYRELAGA